jgi:tetratricopeptide (TPR) repeat protein
MNKANGGKVMNRDITKSTTALHQDSQTMCYNNGRGQEDTGHEKRMHKRLSVTNMNMQSEIPLARRVTVINISCDGVLVKADRRLNIGNTYLLKIGYKENLLFVRAVVRWSFLVESIEDQGGNIVPLYMAGMQFKEITSGKKEEIIHSIMADIEADASQFMEHTENYSGHAQSEASRDSERSGLKEDVDMPHETGHEKAMQDQEGDSLRTMIERIESEYDRCTRKALSYYELLNVGDTAHTEEIKKAYYAKVREFHPDRHSSLPPAAKEQLNSLFAVLNEAYETLTHAGQRNHYDSILLRKQAGNISNDELARQYFEQGKIEFWNGNFSEAEILFQHVLYLCNSSAKSFYYYAKTLLKLEKFREAEKAIRMALKLDSSNSDYLTEAGYIYHALGLSNRAEENFEMALDVEPSHVKARKGIEGIRESGNSDETLFHPMKALKKIIAG